MTYIIETTKDLTVRVRNGFMVGSYRRKLNATGKELAKRVEEMGDRSFVLREFPSDKEARKYAADTQTYLQSP